MADRSSASLATSSMYSATSGSSRALAWKNAAAALSASPAPLSLASLSTCPLMRSSGYDSSTVIAAFNACTAFSLESRDPRRMSRANASTPLMAKCRSPVANVRAFDPVTCTVGLSNTSVAMTSALVRTRDGTSSSSARTTNAAPSAAKNARRLSGDARSIAPNANMHRTRLSTLTDSSSASLASRTSTPSLGSGQSPGRMTPCLAASSSSLVPFSSAIIFRRLTSLCSTSLRYPGSWTVSSP
mmetsp:Transcript_5395/g.20263  ORF Transcript_5395/g.20263 Transcript_5395/m.20263 type:complete len:243 (+) Transcript_5395:101-829(+)